MLIKYPQGFKQLNKKALIILKTVELESGVQTKSVLQKLTPVIFKLYAAVDTPHCLENLSVSETACCRVCASSLGIIATLIR